MAKPRCHFYPGEIARRQCPVVGKPVSSRACGEKYVVELDCPSSCPYLATAIRTEGDRVYQRMGRRIGSEYPVAPEWVEYSGSVFYLGMIETILARFAQWYPAMTDQDARDVSDDLMLDYRSLASGLHFTSRFQNGYLKELWDHLDRKLAFLTLERTTSDGEMVEDDQRDGEVLVARLEAPLKRLGELMERHAAGGTRGYLEFIIPFYDKVETKPLLSASRLILPDDSF